MVRVKHRYLLLNILFPSKTGAGAPTPAYLQFRSPAPSHITPALFVSLLRNSIATHFGDCGLGLTTGSLRIVYLSPATSTVIVRCPRAHYRLVWAALTYVNELPGVRRGERGRECVIQVVRVSGTIRKSEEELLRRARMDLVRAQGDGDDVLSRITAMETAFTATGGASQGQLHAGIEDPEEEDYDEASDNE
ncbi:hypothetical protein DV738_g2751, partial [Chaetothyriales sp. CBS 135597]